MHLTVHTDYALRVLVYLALHGDDLATIGDIAGYFGISRNHLVKVVHNLSQEGFIEAVRGRSGGLRLARPAADLKIGDIVRKTEPGLTMVNCIADGEKCRILQVCGLPVLFRSATSAFFAELDKVTLADIIKKKIPLKDMA